MSRFLFLWNSAKCLVLGFVQRKFNSLRILEYMGIYLNIFLYIEVQEYIWYIPINSLIWCRKVVNNNMLYESSLLPNNHYYSTVVWQFCLFQSTYFALFRFLGLHQLGLKKIPKAATAVEFPEWFYTNERQIFLLDQRKNTNFHGNFNIECITELRIM